MIMAKGSMNGEEKGLVQGTLILEVRLMWAQQSEMENCISTDRGKSRECGVLKAKKLSFQTKSVISCIQRS